VGTLPYADGTGRAGSAECGDLVEIQLSLQGGRVVEAAFRAYGCPATIAGASEVVARVRGRTLLDAARLGGPEVADALQLPPAKRGCSNLAADALHLALEDAVRGRARLVAGGPGSDDRGVLVGMSGGVDSSVAALALSEQGYRVVGVTFRLWSDPACGGGQGCCSPETIVTARETAHRLGLPHLTVDLTGEFYRAVVDDFVTHYERAWTPNPCVSCNAFLRFEALVRLADRLGLRWVATGHYARKSGESGLARGVDSSKDQSYVLAKVDPQLLARALFPLGDLNKAQTRALARTHGLEVHDRPESQEICFIPDDDYRRFLRERLGERPGDIVDPTGAHLGRHRGVYNFTVGQRRGLGLAAPQPLYVVALDPEERRVVVGGDEDAQVSTVWVADIVWHQPSVPRSAWVQMRSSGAPLRAEVWAEEGDLRLELPHPVRGIAPGQTAVLYDSLRVLAAGTIVRTEASLPGSAGPSCGPSAGPSAVGPAGR